MENVECVEHLYAQQIAADGNEVGHKTTALAAQFEKCPTMIVAIKTNEKGGHEDGEQVHQAKHHEPIACRQQTEIAEGEQYNKTYQRQVKGGEHHADSAGSNDDAFLF